MTQPALLTMADYYGTLAGVRSLGRSGVPLTVAEWRTFAPAKWSRYVRRRVECPSVGDPDAFMEWLVAFGAKEPGHVLFPTSDDLAWLYSVHRDRLRANFLLYQPPEESVLKLLDKEALHSLCLASGLGVPQTWFPRSEDDLSQVDGFPVLLKPKTQVTFESHSKGARVDRPEGLRDAYRSFLQKSRFHPALLDRRPSLARPAVQRYHPDAARSIYSLSGFVDETGELFVVRAARKVLQRPRKLGIGLCFEEAPVEPTVAKKVRRLCKDAGFFGVFEVEFLQGEEGFLVIDFNPRLYSQLAFDTARGLPLPLLFYHAASGNPGPLAQAVREASASTQPGTAVYCHRFVLEVLLWSQRASGRMSGEEFRHWRQWLFAHRTTRVDAAMDGRDPMPALVDWASHLWSYARHPRHFINTMVLDR